MTKILDCTLRDGGYYNDWNFPLSIVKKTIYSLAEAGVDIIEVGLKSYPDEVPSGLYKYCNEDYLGFLGEFSDQSFSFMLNVKEFLIESRDVGTRIDESRLDEIILNANDSVFDVCRLAFHYSDIEEVPSFQQYFAQKGYTVGMNLMGISLLDDEKIEHALSVVSKSNPDVFYVADSFGSMLPSDIYRLAQTVKSVFGGPIGVHLHDNQGLAFANALQAIDEGIEYIDATLTGMGRGAGNLHTEQILLWLQNRSSASNGFHSGKVLDVIHEYYEPLKAEYRWGFNYAYMLSGLTNIHPVYCMNLCDGNKFSMSQMTEIIGNIPRESRSSFQKSALGKAIGLAGVSGSSKQGPLNSIPLFDPERYESEGGICLIVAPGLDVDNYQYAVDNLLSRSNLFAIECNNTGALVNKANRLTVVLNEMRLSEILKLGSEERSGLVTGVATLASDVPEGVYHFECRIGETGFGDRHVAIPAFEAGQYAISLAIRLGYRRLLLAGFSGYETAIQNEEMERYFSELINTVKGLSLTNLTPSSYQTPKSRSIYTL